MIKHQRTTLIVAALVAMVFGWADFAKAGIVNPSFETGDLTGWTATLDGGVAEVVGSHTGDLGRLYEPTHGVYLLRIRAGSAHVWQTVTQTVSLTAGDELCGYAGFDWRDYGKWVDGARVRILDSVGGEVATPYFRNGAGFPDYVDDTWTRWTWTAATAGTYTLEYGVLNIFDSGLSSWGVFDACPEPGTISLCLLGSLVLVPRFLSRKRRSA